MQSKMPNLGPKSLAMLHEAGIASMDDLVELGSVRAYLCVKKVCPSASLNLLWALEGALSNRHWQDVAHNNRLHLLTLLELTKNHEA